ncbi:MAG: flagellin [Anaerovibrio sp.]|uniref:flagellin n=1 Tax=Anaerovibrio sp. TaxID=1872532 RepID=UPI001B2E59F1|nr:flagellin [Anaerovibrio sp.]MBO5588493.1 flagellin [Anaerovibrio sp.]MBO6245588.1 flagellin [Anaerovibrio sp.]
MGIVNNISSNMILGELHKNTKKKDKASAQLALGEKIRNAGDDASGLAISEKMRVRLRALGQDEANVKNGASMLRTAEGAIQSQINLLRTIKAKVIDAHNDTNTDVDRAIIQKEISQYYDEINDIAAETTFNSKLLLLGDTVQETVKSWVVMDHAELVEGSDSLNLIPNTTEDVVNGQPGPFDTFGKKKSESPGETIDYDGYILKNISATTIPGYDTAATTTDSMSKLHGGTENKPNTIDINLAGMNNAGLDNTAFSVTLPKYPWSRTYVLTTDTSRHYQNGDSDSYEINISGKDNSQIASAIADKINSQLSSFYSASASGEKVTLTTIAPSASYNDEDILNSPSYYNVAGVKLEAGASSSGEDRDGATATGLGTFNLSGGKNEVAHWVEWTNPETDATESKKVVDAEAVPATASKNISSVPAGSGFILYVGSSNYYIGFEEGKGKFRYDSSKGHYVVGKNWSGNQTLGNVKLQFSSGTMNMTCTYGGTGGNDYGVTSDGFSSSSSSTTPGYYTAASALTGITNNKNAENGLLAHWDWNFPEYKDSHEEKVEDFIKGLVGKAFIATPYSSTTFEFIDSGKSPAVDSLYKINNSSLIDLNTLRTSVAGGKTVSEAFANLITSKLGSRAEAIKDGDKVTGVKITASYKGKDGNDQYLTFREGGLRSYTVDFDNFFSSNGIADSDIPSTLDGKGIRFYCATDSNQWVNVQFVNGVSPDDDDRPSSGTASLDIKTFVVDVSDVTDVESLVKTIYEGDGNKNPQGLEDWLTTKYKHFFHVAADYENGSLTIYDSRRYTLLNRESQYKDLQKPYGAKIADGVLDNVKQDVRYVYVNDLVIHHTDRSSANIHVRIPQTTMDHIFGYKVGTYSLDDYSVMTSEKREKLLGTDGPPKVEGTLDKGLQYLIDANTLIGAQIVHMEHAEANIITDQESTASAESVIRDADMAKSSLELATAQILAQSGQTMLSQSNQNSSNVLSLLQ